MLSRSIVVSNGVGRFHMHHAAAAAERAGMLRWFLTTFAVTAPWQERLLASRPVRMLLGPNMSKKASMRKYHDIAPNRTKAFSLLELYFRLSSARAFQRIPPIYNNSASLTLQLFGWLSSLFVEDASIFHVRSGFGRHAMQAARRSGGICLVDHSIPEIRFLQQIMDQEYTRWGLPSAKKQRSNRLWELVSSDLDEADYVLVNSEFVKDTLLQERKHLRGKISIIPMGVDTDLFCPGVNRAESQDDCFRILYVGQMSWRKGVVYLLEAAKRLRLKNSEVILVGVMDDLEPLLEQYEGLFRYVSHVPQPELVSYYQRASVFVFPSLAEGSARVTYEAMAAGIPTMTTPNSGSVLRDGIDGLIVPPGDIEALMDAIDRLYHQPELRRAMGESARERVMTSYTWEHYKQAVIALYNDLASQSSCN